MIVGTAGHIDHGKSSLVRALTGVDTDRLKEEKARGISIDLGFAYTPTPDGAVLGFVDVPGHEKFVHTMLAGAAGVDFVLLVVAADDGVMPQTREHLAILELLGLDRGVVALTKCDMVSPERLAEATTGIANLLATSPLADAEIVPVSCVTGQGVDHLRQRLFETSANMPARADERAFRFAVDRSFTLSGAGTIVTGIVLSGQVAVGDRVVVSPSGRAARVRSIHAQNRAAEHGRAGERCALNLSGEDISKDAIERGDFVLAGDLHAPTDRIDVSFRLLASEKKPVGQWTPIRLHHAASDVAARLVLLGDEPIAPGDEVFAQLVLEKPVAAAVGDRFVARDTTAQRTIGGGVFIDLRAPTRKRRTLERRAILEAAARRDDTQALLGLLATAPFFVDLAVFARDRALGDGQYAALVENLGIVELSGGGTRIGLSRETFDRLVESLVATLAAFHADNPDLPGLGFERLRLMLEPRLPAPAFRGLLQSPALGARIALDGAWARLVEHQVRLQPDDEALWSRIAPMISGEERFRPPRVRDIADALDLREPDIRRLMKILGRMGKVDEVAHDHFFLRATVAEMTAIAADIAGQAQQGQFSAAEFRDRLDNGRKVAIQILEFFDRHGVTFRRGDLRRINRHRLDLFGAPPGR
ncbi:MAG TPA: selenocysteine-specific translation elongation factor [Rhodoblastus sp.]|nr:selenocysteine-specific translation elongation factor [Rhodoblastus sp.]